MSGDAKRAFLSIALVLVVVVGVLIAWSWTSVEAGKVAVVTSFGEVQGEPLEPGFHWLAFWKKTNAMSVQTQEDKETASVPTKEGLIVELEASLIYSVKKDKAAEIYKTVGLNYKDVIVVPQFRSVLRGVTARYKAEDLYTAHRSEMEDELERGTRALLDERGVVCERVLLRNIELPSVVTKAIQRKMASEQEAAAMEFVILKAKKEAERVREEAKGIADSQKTIQGTLNENYLRYLWIKSLQEAAQHQATLIYIPTGNDGLPVFADAARGTKTKQLERNDP